jgi:SAM-dependent methyltransferase
MTEAEALLSEARHFMRSRALLTAAELDLFTALDGGPISAPALAEARGLDPRATARLLDCLVTFGLLTKAGGRYHTTAPGALVSSAHPESVRPMLLHMGHVWRNWSHLTDTVRAGVNAGRAPVTGSGPDTLDAFIRAMHVTGRTLSREIAAACDLTRFHRVLDVGGASGTYTIAFLERHPHLRGVIFDLPGAIGIARDALEAQGLQERVDLVAGDFYRDELPGGCDVAWLSAIVHQNSPEQNLALFRKVHRALPSGGVLLIRDHVMDEDRTRPPAGALFALNMLVSTDGGDTYTFGELERGLTEAGFGAVRLLRSGERMDGLVEAEK